MSVHTYAWLVPKGPVTIPRLELTSAVVAVKAAITLNEEFTYENAEHFFWTDNKLFMGI